MTEPNSDERADQFDPTSPVMPGDQDRASLHDVRLGTGDRSSLRRVSVLEPRGVRKQTNLVPGYPTGRDKATFRTALQEEGGFMSEIQWKYPVLEKLVTLDDQDVEAEKIAVAGLQNLVLELFSDDGLGEPEEWLEFHNLPVPQTGDLRQEATFRRRQMFLLSQLWKNLVFGARHSSSERVIESVNQLTLCRFTDAHQAMNHLNTLLQETGFAPPLRPRE